LGIGISHFLLFLSPSLSFHIIFRLIQGVFFGFPIGAISYLLSVVSKEEQSMNIGFAGAMFGIGWNLAAVGSILLAYLYIRLPSLVGCFVSLLNAFILWYYLDPIYRTRTTALPKSPLQSFSDIFQMLKISQLRPILIMRTISEITLSLGNFSNLEFIRTSPIILLNKSYVSGLYLCIGILTLIVTANIKRLTELIGGEPITVICGYVVSSIAMLMVTMSESRTGVIMCFIMFAVGSCYQAALLNSLVAQRVSEDKKGIAISYGESMSALGGILGPIIVGLLFPLGKELPYYSYCLLITAGITQFLWLLMREEKKKSTVLDG
jgi:predicted MFS family arabinose efflux permease